MKIEIDGQVVFDEENSSPITVTDLSFYAAPTWEEYPIKNYTVPDNQEIRNFRIRSFDLN